MQEESPVDAYPLCSCLVSTWATILREYSFGRGFNPTTKVMDLLLDNSSENQHFVENDNRR